MVKVPGKKVMMDILTDPEMFKKKKKKKTIKGNLIDKLPSERK
jgi:hypothetical protein